VFPAVVILLLSTCADLQAELVPITDYTMCLPIKKVSGTASPMEIYIDEVYYYTGEIYLTLDPAYELEDSYMQWNFSDGSIVQEYHLLVDFSATDIPAQKLHITEVGASGTFNVNPTKIDSDPDVWTKITMTFNNDLTGSGYFEDGQIMEGWTYSNHWFDLGTAYDFYIHVGMGHFILDPDKEYIIPDNYFNLRVKKLNIIWTDPWTGEEFTPVFGAIEVTAPPEPATLSLLALGGVVLLIGRRRR